MIDPAVPGRLMRAGRAALALALAASLGACASAPASNPRDPLERFNRAMFTFNDTIDQVALKPAATAYKNVLPTFVQTGVSNFFGNLSDVWSSVNNLLQAKGEAGMSDLTRVALNSTFGFGGLLDIASEAGLRKHNEDFGQTLGTWGVKPGPYLMLPLFGASTLRDTVALPLDMLGDPLAYKNPAKVRYMGTVLRIVDQRAVFLDASNLMEEAALDRYEFVRDSFLQRQQSRIEREEAPGRKSNVGANADGVSGSRSELGSESGPNTHGPGAGTETVTLPTTAILSSEPTAKELSKATQ